jgi:hypothetical protein
MGWTFHSLDDLPYPDDIVWCRWPKREDKLAPGEIIRGALVRERKFLEHKEWGRYGALVVSYATGQFDPEVHGEIDLILNRAEALSVGLHKATRFSLDLRDRKQLPWCEEYFTPQPYVVGRGIHAGTLTEDHKQRMLACLKKRGLA